MTDAYLGEIRLLPFFFAPKDWLPCDGRLMGVASNQALFALLSTQFGGDGKSTFGLPDLRGRVIVGGQPGSAGQQGGAESVVLTPAQMPAHSHAFRATTTPGDTAAVANAVFAAVTDAPNPAPNFYGPLNPPLAVDPDSIAGTGNGQPHNNMQPYTALQYCICVGGGIFPST